MFKQLLFICIMIATSIFPINSIGEEVTKSDLPNYHISFREPIEYTFENSSDEETIENLGTPENFDWEDWKISEGDTLFGRFLLYTKLWITVERGFHPKEYTVTPLFWSLVIGDTLDDWGKNDVFIDIWSGGSPVMSEEFVCLVRNRNTGNSYFVCLRRDPHSLPPSGFFLRPVGYVKNQEGKYDRSIYQINPEQEYQQQLTDFLRHISFGPNVWLQEHCRCVAVSVYCPKSEREGFVYPEISKETREKFYKMARSHFIMKTPQRNSQ